MTQPTRYELTAPRHSRRPGDLASSVAEAGAAARRAVGASCERDAAIRDVAVGVAGPALTGCVIWMLREAQTRRLRRLRFLSRDGQVLYELAKRIAPKLGIDLDLRYVYSSRLTWSLAATDAKQLSSTQWLFNSFMKSNADDVCARLGLRAADYAETLRKAGVSLDPEARADRADQHAALRRFLASPDVAHTAGRRIAAMRDLVIDYARQNQLADAGTGLVDIGWTGRMIGSLISICEPAEMSRPHILLWGHEPRATGWTDPDRVAAYMYNTATGQGLDWRVPDAPFIMETFSMGDHGIVTGYERDSSDRVVPILNNATNIAARAWGLDLYRSALYAFSEALDCNLDGEIRPQIHEAMDTFWCHPTLTEAETWGAYPYDSDPAGTAVRRLARPFPEGDELSTVDEVAGARGDRAWIAGSLATSTPAARLLYSAHVPHQDNVGAPATD